MAKEKQKKKRKGGALKVILILLVIIAILVAIILFGGKGFGFGNGGDGINDGNANVESEVSTDDSQADVTGGEEGDLGTTVVVTIKGEQVFVGDKEFADASALKAYIEEINADGKEFKLKDENSILATYEWVNEVFEELKIQLIPVEE